MKIVSMAQNVPGHDRTYQAQAGLLQGGLPKTLLADRLGAERAPAAVLEMMHQGPGTALEWQPWAAERDLPLKVIP